jgi:hypothetical protein
MGLYLQLIVHQDDEFWFSTLDAHKGLYWHLYLWACFFEWIRLLHLFQLCIRMDICIELYVFLKKLFACMKVLHK